MSKLIEAFKEYLIINRALSKSTVSAYINDITQFQEFYRQDLLTANTNDILEFLRLFKKARTLNRKLSAINTFYNFCKDLEFGEVDVKLSSSKIPKNLPSFLEKEQILNAVNSINVKNWLDLRDKALILFLYATGVRVSEAIKANREDINNGWLRVRFGKGEKERFVPIAKVATDAIDKYLEARDDLEPALFVNYKKNPISRISVFKITKKYLGVSPHVLRHSYASSLILGGADLRVVQELLGHSSLLTTQIYTHIQKPHLKDTVNDFHPLAKSN
jgi:integrase/recombinase XerD